VPDVAMDPADDPVSMCVWGSTVYVHGVIVTCRLPVAGPRPPGQAGPLECPVG
jgi:hypothetical protein